MVLITAEWARWGKQSADSEYRILDHGRGQLSGGNFTEILTRYSPGRLEDLPQVTVSWVGSEEPRIGFAIHELSPDVDAMGRDIVVTRYFCLLYEQITQPPISYEALYRAFNDCSLPADGSLLTLEVPLLDPEILALRVDQTAISAASLLMTGRQVNIVGGKSVKMLQRLQFLDTVAALLPYGMRTRLTASTLASSTWPHRIRLSFASHALPEAYSVTWGASADISAEENIAHRYHELLMEEPDFTQLINRFTAETRPLTFGIVDRRWALALLEGDGRHQALDELGGSDRPTSALPTPTDVHFLIHVAKYLGPAAAAGIIGNRADAAVKRIFQSVRDRWRRHAKQADAPLSEVEAVDAATAAALAQEYYPPYVIRAVEARLDNSWVVFLEARTLSRSGSTLTSRERKILQLTAHAYSQQVIAQRLRLSTFKVRRYTRKLQRRSTPQLLRVIVPAGDPANAEIHIYPKQ